MEDVDWVLVFVDFVPLIFDRLRFFYVARDNFSTNGRKSRIGL